MNKLVAALIASTVACGAFAQATSAPMGGTTAPAMSDKASAPMKKHHDKKAMKSHKGSASMPAASKPAM